MPEIHVKELSKYYESVRALHTVSLNIKDGEYVVLLGPSGCGKTTLLKCIAGTITPSSGRIVVDKKDFTKMLPEDRHIGFVFQNYALFPHLSVVDNARYGMMARGENPDKAKRIAMDMLRMVHLEERADALVRELSGGMQQRLAVARALSTGSKLLLLDEPTNALDAYIRVELRVELRKMAKRLGLTAIHVTHDQEEAMAIADKIVVMKKGEVLQVGTPKEVYEHPNNLFLANFLGEANFIRTKFVDTTANVLGQKITIPKQNGEKIVVIRPEYLRFSEQGTKIELVNTQYFGPFYKYEIDYDGLRLKVRSHMLWDNPKYITFDPKHLLIFDEPAEGLEKSLMV